VAELLSAAGVSEREAEVLALVGEHLTNAEVAARLFISVRTVESHVSSLLRKLRVGDRRALAELAVTLRLDEGRPAAPTPSAVLPSPLTSFVGRAAERSALAEALGQHRLVTAVGPGGVGKTRLGLAVAADLTDRYTGGTWYVDLVPVTDPTMVDAAVASALGLGEQLGRTPTETVIARLATAQALVVLDNCEHVLDGVVELVERLLSGCPHVVVLATSRARLVVPFESVFPVPGLSLDDAQDNDGDSDSGGGGDAVALFVERAAMAGWSPSSADDRRRIAAICAGLDGLALAIELAAAQLPTLGLDGVEAALADRLGLLTGGRRLDERHQSVRSALDWSYGLLDANAQAVLRRTSVFAMPFTVDAAASVAGFAPLAPGQLAAGLARLADHSLLVVTSQAGTTRYRMLETIRQYGAGLLDEDEGREARVRHLSWCRATTDELEANRDAGAAFDAVADDLRAALGWAAQQPGLRDDAHHLALQLAELVFARGMPREAQHRYELAAELAVDDAERAAALHLAADAALCRLTGESGLELFGAATEAARRAGDLRRAAVELTRTAEFLVRSPGMLSRIRPQREIDALLAEARRLAGEDPYVQAAILTVQAGETDDDPREETICAPLGDELAQRAVELARQTGDARLESAALDQLTVVHLAQGRVLEAAASTRRRIELLTPRALDVDVAFEFSDALHMAPMTHFGAGDLVAGQRYAQQRHSLAFFREEGHLRVDWLLVGAALAGDLDEAVVLADRFRDGWERTGRLPLGGFAVSPAAAALVHGLRGDDAARAEWLNILAAMRRVVAPLAGRVTGYGPAFDAMVAVHRGDLDAAVAALTDEPETFTQWVTGVWRQWYAAIWAEVGMLAGVADATERLARARRLVEGNPIATAILDRTEALAAEDRGRLLAAATALETAGCRYQQARTLILAGGDERAEGEALLAAAHAAPMAVAPMAL
jgi:predicted ATPase/DNA-binding CsgD family transcriptional regulator